jgi:hypothetical protein
MKWQRGPQTEHFFLNRFKPINLEAEERGSNKYRYGTTTMPPLPPQQWEP